MYEIGRGWASSDNDYEIGTNTKYYLYANILFNTISPHRFYNFETHIIRINWSGYTFGDNSKNVSGVQFYF